MDYRSKKRNFNEPADWKIFKDYDKVPPIVSEELWEKANQKLWQRSKLAKGERKYQNKYALSGKLYCEKHRCGFVRKVRHYKDKEDVVYWYCKDFHKTGKRNCIPACFKEEDLYSILLSIFQTYEIYKEEICKEEICKELLSFYLEQSKKEEWVQQETRLQNDLASLQKRKDKLLDLALDGLLSKEDLSSKNVSIGTEITQIQARLKELEGKKAKPKEQKKQEQMLKKSILKELFFNRENLESYIEGLLEKIVVVEKDKEAELQIILGSDKVVYRGNPSKNSKISSTDTDLKNRPICHSHAHGGDNVVVLKNADKYGGTSFTKIKTELFFRL